VWSEYVGGYQDWLRQKRVRNAPKATAQTPQRAAPAKPAPTKKRLSYKEQRELDAMPQTIDTLEAAQKELQQRIAHRDFYKQDKVTIAETLAAFEKSQAQLAAAYARWEQLDAGS
jgi:ATP-binding cassette subfamily F protein uup